MFHQWVVQTVRNGEPQEETISLSTLRKRVIEGTYSADNFVRKSDEIDYYKLRQVAYLFNFESMINRGIQLFRAYYWKEAIIQLEHATKFKDSLATAWFLLAIIKEVNSCPIDKTMEAYEKCIAQNYKTAIACNNKGVIMVQQSMSPDITLNYFEKSMTFSPKLAAPHYNLGNVYKHFHKTKLRTDKNYEEEYLREFKKAFDLDETNTENLDDPFGDHRANFIFEDAIPKHFGANPDKDKLNRKKARTFIDKANKCLDQDDWDKALLYFDLADKHNPEVITLVSEGKRKAVEGKKGILYTNLEKLLDNGDFDKAIIIFNEIISLDVARPEIEKALNDIQLARARNLYTMGFEQKMNEQEKDAYKNFSQAKVFHADYSNSVKKQLADMEIKKLLNELERYRKEGEYEKAISSADEIILLSKSWKQEIDRLIDVLRTEKANSLFKEGKEAIDKKKYKQARCLVPLCDGICYDDLPSKEELWDRYYTGAPKRLRQCVEQYKLVKRA